MHWIEGARYLFPYSDGGGFYPTHTYVTKYEDNCVVEEYMVNGSLIIHETYTKNSSGEIDYNYINYVSDGKYPVLEERTGRFYLNPLTYVEVFKDDWLNQREV